jgi:RNA polymerase sigma factor (TIGR02999 family)
MAEAIPEQVAALLRQAGAGDSAAAERLVPVLYDELKALARAFFRSERPDHTLQPTAVVNELYLRLADRTDLDLSDRAQFFSLAATAMRHILADHARRQRAEKRGGGRQKLSLEAAVTPLVEGEVDVIDLNGALERLAALDARKARVVELRFFAGLTNQEVAEVLGVSRKTVVDDWTVARLWLRRELARDAAE